MSECEITLKLGTDDASKSLDLILGFQSLYALQSQDAETIKPVMAKYFGQSCNQGGLGRLPTTVVRNALGSFMSFPCCFRPDVESAWNQRRIIS